MTEPPHVPQDGGVATPGTRLSLAAKELVVERPDQPRKPLPIEDCSSSMTGAPPTHMVFVELLSAGKTVMVSGPDHLPAWAKGRRPRSRCGF
ncbi:MAG: hypothetical protein J2P49_05560 [Methylocapsa sp.]|nr:hypothetical protein [Methylocapsa sp.]